MIRIEIDSTQVETRNGTSKTGKAYTSHRQVAYLHGVGKYPVQGKVPVPVGPAGQPEPYQPGYYTLADASYRVSDYGDFELNPFEIKLVRLEEKQEARPVRAAG